MRKQYVIGAFALFLTLSALLSAATLISEFAANFPTATSGDPVALNEGNSGAYFPDRGSG
jgi:hypothetical protein